MQRYEASSGCPQPSLVFFRLFARYKKQPRVMGQHIGSTKWSTHGSTHGSAQRSTPGSTHRVNTLGQHIGSTHWVNTWGQHMGQRTGSTHWVNTLGQRMILGQHWAQHWDQPSDERWINIGINTVGSACHTLYRTSIQPATMELN